jgi:hypothetical protein
MAKSYLLDVIYVFTGKSYVCIANPKETNITRMPRYDDIVICVCCGAIGAYVNAATRKPITEHRMHYLTNHPFFREVARVIAQMNLPGSHNAS